VSETISWDGCLKACLQSLLQDLLAGQQNLFAAQLNLLAGRPNTNQTRNKQPPETSFEGSWRTRYIVVENVFRHRPPSWPAGPRTEKKPHAQDWEKVGHMPLPREQSPQTPYKTLYDQKMRGHSTADVRRNYIPMGHHWIHGGDYLLWLYPNCLLGFFLSCLFLSFMSLFPRAFVWGSDQYTCLMGGIWPHLYLNLILGITTNLYGLGLPGL